MSLIDSSSFDASKTFNELISSHTFEELLLMQNNLTSEIKSLDGNMQTLVYENYNKFISATDTIRSMKSHIESMESEMRLLETSIEKVQSIHSKVSEKVSPKQQQICKLINVYEELQKIKNICDLPSVLKSAIEKNSNKLHIDFENAAKSYHDSISFLTQHKFDTSYASIYQETSDCVDKIRRVIWDKINDLSLTHETFAKYCHELHLFGEEGEKLPSIYCNYFLNIFKEKIGSLYNSSTQVTQVKTSFVLPEDTSLDSILEDSKKAQLQDENEEIQDFTFSWYVLQVHEHVIPLLEFSLKNFKLIFGSSFPGQYQAYCKEITLHLIQNSKNKLKELKSNLSAFCIALHFIHLDLQVLSPFIPNISDRFSEFLEFLVRFQIEQIIDSLQIFSCNTIQTLHQEISNNKEKFPEKIEIPAEKASISLLYFLLTEIVKLQPMLKSCKNFIASGSTIVSLIVSHLLNFFQILRKNILNFSTNSTDAQEYENKDLRGLNKSGGFLIGLLKFFIYLEENVTIILNTLSKNFLELEYDMAEVNDIVSKTAKSEFLVVLKLCQEDLLHFYIEHYSKHFITLISEYCSQKWKFQDEPIDVSVTMCDITSTLLNARKELKAFFHGEFITTQKVARKRAKNMVELQLERIHARKSKVVETLKFDLQSILGVLAKIMFKALYEEIRLHEFGTGGYQQIEVDSKFLGSCITSNFLEETLVSGYVQEIISSASFRCTNCLSLPSTILESVLENKKKQMKEKKPST